ncbi:MAG TPA: hypothetical protein VKA08_16975 [Balneolales bacterium]|nr:hypothetical protein [Balneolales bacterium]
MSKQGSDQTGLIFFCLLVLLPMILGAGYALLYSLGLTGLLAHGFTFHYWIDELTNPELWSSLGFSLYIAVASIVPSVVLALFLVQAAPDFPRRPALSVILYLPLVVPAVMAAFLIFQLYSESGFISRLLYHLGMIHNLHQFPGLVNDQLGIGILLTHIGMATPFFYLLFTNLYHQERIDEYSALATTLGTPPRQVFRRVIAPVLLRRSQPTLLLYLLFAFGSYEIPLLIGPSNPRMLSVLAIQKLQMFDLNQVPVAYVINLIYLGIVGLALLLHTTSPEDEYA